MRNALARADTEVEIRAVRAELFDKLRTGYVSAANGVETSSSFDFGLCGPKLRMDGHANWFYP